MHLWHSTRARRFATAALFSLPLTVALLFLMTRLILPGETDRIVNRMIQDIEFLRIESPPDPAGIHVYELPEEVEKEPPIKEPDPPLEVADQSQVQNQVSNENDEEEPTVAASGQRAIERHFRNMIQHECRRVM